MRAAILLCALSMTGCGWPRVVPTGEDVHAIVGPNALGPGECAEPEVRWESADGLALVYDMDERCGPAASLAIPRVPTAEVSGVYEVHILGLGDGSEADGVAIVAVPSVVFAMLLALLTGLLALGVARPNRWLLLGLGLASPLWVPLLFGRILWLVVFGVALGALFRWRHHTRAPRAVACGGAMLLFEHYWGVTVGGAGLHGFVLSGSVVLALWLVTRRNRWAVWSATLGLAAFHVAINVYASYFGDFPAAATLDQLSQAGSVMDSVWTLLRAEHVLTLTGPFAILLLPTKGGSGARIC